MRNWMIFPLAAGLLLTGGQRAAAAHPFHETVTEVRYNAEKACYEIAVKAYPEELEAAVTLSQRRRFRLAAPDAEERLAEYVKRTLEVRWGQSPGELQWVGLEESPKDVWIYVQWNRPAEAKADAAPELRNRLLFELYDDQSNIVVRRIKGKREAVTLSPTNWKLNLKP